MTSSQISSRHWIRSEFERKLDFNKAVSLEAAFVFAAVARAKTAPQKPKFTIFNRKKQPLKFLISCRIFLSETDNSWLFPDKELQRSTFLCDKSCRRLEILVGNSSEFCLFSEKNATKKQGIEEGIFSPSR